MDCIFCKIVNGDIPSYTLYEDDMVKCFLDVNPESNGHTLIIPKKHFICLDDIEQDYLNHIMEVAKKIKLNLEKKLDCDGIKLIQNNGIIQEVKHYHLHLIPVYNKKKELDDIENIYKKLKES